MRKLHQLSIKTKITITPPMSFKKIHTALQVMTKCRTKKSRIETRNFGKMQKPTTEPMHFQQSENISHV